MKTLLFSLSLFLFLAHNCFSQLPFENSDAKRFRFAQTTIGGDLRFTPAIGNSSYYDNEGSQQSYEVGNAAWGRFVISGWHFWGHVDFYFGLPLIKATESVFGEAGNSFYNNGVETGVKLYPSKLKDGKIRPFLGVSFNNTVFWQEQDNVKHQNLARNTWPLQAGATYVRKKNIFDIGLTFNHQTNYGYYISKVEQANIDLPALNISLGWRTYFDSSLKDEKALLDGRLETLGKKMKTDRKASGVSFAVGLSSPFYLRNSFNSEYFPYLGDLRFSNSFLDLGLGYYLAGPDMHVNMAYRSYKSKLEAFDTRQVYQRNAIGLEVYKFIADYHGFVPFLGAIASYDRNEMRVDVENSLVLDHKEESLRYGIVIGWDIRQDKIQHLILRTNLRYFPGYDLSINNNKERFDQLEFNLIQAVYYPTRHRWVNRNKPKKW